MIIIFGIFIGYSVDITVTYVYQIEL